MKKFICALSSFVLAATAMGSSVAMSSTAATNGKVDSTIIAFQSNGKSEVNVNAGDTVPVSVYIPQSSGFNDVLLKLSIGLDGKQDDTLGKGTIEDRNGKKIENYKDAFGYYGIEMIPKGDKVVDKQIDFTYPNCLVSGAYGNDLEGNSWFAGDIDSTGKAYFNGEAWSILYKYEEALYAKKDADSFGAWVAAGGTMDDIDSGEFDYSDYTPVTTWTKDEDWAYKYSFAKFDLKLPSDLPDGKYVVSLYRDRFVNCHPSSLFTDDNQWKEESERTYGQTKISGVNGDQKIDIEELTIVVGNPTDTTKATETTTTKSETKPTSDTTKSTASSEEAGNKIVYNLIPQGLDYETAASRGKDNNLVKMDKGGELKVDWTIQNDQGTAGIQMNFDFTEVEYQSGKAGKAYRITPTYSDYKNGKDLKQGEVTYAWAQDTEAKAKDNTVIYTFTVNVPDEKGTYTMKLDEGKNGNEELTNKVIPQDQTKKHDFIFHGLDIEVGGESSETKPSDTTKSETKPTSDSKKTNETITKPSEKAIIYNLIPQGVDYESAEENGTAFNVVNLKEGGELKVDWTIKNDQGTAGIQMNFDFTEVEYVSGKAGKAYRITPTYSDYKNGKDLKRGEVTYAWAQDTEAKAKDDAVIYTFTVNVPDEKGTYTMKLDDGKSGSEELTNKVIPQNQDDRHEFFVYGLQINVDPDGGETSDTTSETTKETTTVTETTTTQETTSTIETSSGTTESETSETTSTSKEDSDVLYGDVNCSGDVRINDVVLLNKYLAKNAKVSKQGLLNADCEKDDKVDAKDATKIKQYLALLIDKSELGKKSS